MSTRNHKRITLPSAATAGSSEHTPADSWNTQYSSLLPTNAGPDFWDRVTERLKARLVNAGASGGTTIFEPLSDYAQSQGWHHYLRPWNDLVRSRNQAGPTALRIGMGADICSEAEISEITFVKAITSLSVELAGNFVERTEGYFDPRPVDPAGASKGLYSSVPSGGIVDALGLRDMEKFDGSAKREPGEALTRDEMKTRSVEVSWDPEKHTFFVRPAGSNGHFKECEAKVTLVSKQTINVRKAR